MKQWNEASETSQDSVRHMGKGTISFRPSLPIVRHKTMCERAASTQATGGQGRGPGSRQDHTLTVKVLGT